jgi:ribose transport system substrate-binding protein
MHNRPSTNHFLLSLASIALAVSLAGCGGKPSENNAPANSGPAASASPSASSKPVVFVGFDGSPPLIEAMRQGKIQGLVLQDPFQMGYKSVVAISNILRKKPVEAVIGTGEHMITPETVDKPEMKDLVLPPKVEHTTDSKATGKKEKTYRVMVIPKGTTHEHWKAVHAGAAKAATELGDLEIIWQGPTKEDDRADQIKLVQSAIASNVDGMILAPLDARALVEPVEQAIAKNIPVVIFDSALESKKIAGYVATNNYNGGVIAAKRLGESLGGKGRIILLRYSVGSASTDEREKGFTDTIAKEFPGITYLSNDQYAGATADSAQQASQNLIARYRGQIDGVFCPNESSTLGMLRVLDSMGLTAHK